MADEDARFRAQLEHRISSYALLSTRLEARIAELQEELETVVSRRQSAEALYRVEFGEVFDGNRPVERPASRTRSGPLSGLSWVDAITRVLREEGPALHVKQIWEGLDAGGFRTDARDPLRSIVAIAVREPTIVKVAPNTYGLVSRSENSSREQEEVRS